MGGCTGTEASGLASMRCALRTTSLLAIGQLQTDIDSAASETGKSVTGSRFEVRRDSDYSKCSLHDATSTTRLPAASLSRRVDPLRLVISRCMTLVLTMTNITYPSVNPLLRFLSSSLDPRTPRVRFHSPFLYRSSYARSVNQVGLEAEVQKSMNANDFGNYYSPGMVITKRC